MGWRRPTVLALALATTLACAPSAQMPWLVSGSPAAVDAVIRQATGVTGVRLVDRATGAATAFAQFEIASSVNYGDFMGLMNLAADRSLTFVLPSGAATDCTPAVEAEPSPVVLEAVFAPLKRSEAR